MLNITGTRAVGKPVGKARRQIALSGTGAVVLPAPSGRAGEGFAAVDGEDLDVGVDPAFRS